MVWDMKRKFIVKSKLSGLFLCSEGGRLFESKDFEEAEIYYSFHEGNKHIKKWLTAFDVYEIKTYPDGEAYLNLMIFN